MASSSAAANPQIDSEKPDARVCGWMVFPAGGQGLIKRFSSQERGYVPAARKTSARSWRGFFFIVVSVFPNRLADQRAP
ncbi:MULTISPECIES: hypothetical protein [unclassified Mesorhizobium]|uniref:hypothetical protein n=1 Tax=unclassified Mesorhizobium TaxID=325217 RepID=UPI0030146E08